MINVNQLVDIIGKFKNLKRQGWIDKGVVNPESDAEHSFSLALLVMLLAPEELNKQRCLELALIHDLAEIYAGDHTPKEAISLQEKLQKENVGMEQIANELGQNEWLELFDEYNSKVTKESIFINALDKLDNVITAAYYDKNKRSLQKLTMEFEEYAKVKIDELGNNELLSEIKNILQEINQANLATD